MAEYGRLDTMEEALRKTDAQVQQISTSVAKLTGDQEDQAKVLSEMRAGQSRLETMFASLMEKLQSNSILVKIHQLDYVISWDVLEQVFAGFGDIEYLEVFSSDDDYHSKIRFRSPYSAYQAFYSLNHRNIYEGCCRLELFRVTEVVGEQEIESPIEDLSEGMDSSTLIVDDPGKQENSDERSQSPPSNLDEVISETSTLQSEVNLALKDSDEPSIEVLDELAIDDFGILWSVKDDLASKELGEPIDFGVNSVSFMEISSARQVFVERTEKEFVLFGLSAVLNHDALRRIHVVDGKWVVIFDPGGLCCVKAVMIGINMNKNTPLPSTNIHELEFERLDEVFYHHFESTSSAIGAVLFGLKFIKDDKTSMPFDRGRICVAQAALFDLKLFKEARGIFGNGCCFSPCVIASLYGKILVFDPGIPTGQIAIKSVLKCIFVQLNQLGRQPRESYPWSNGSRFIKHIVS